MKTALIFGATGHIGEHLLQKVLNSKFYKRMIVVVRSKVSLNNPKLEIIQADFADLDKLKIRDVDDAFVIIGSPNKVIERQYPVKAAKVAKSAGAFTISVVTAVGADIKSRMNYTRVKGEIESDIMSLGFRSTHFFRPGMILGRTRDFRPMERIMMRLWPIIQPLLRGSFEKYRGISGEKIASAMFAAAQTQTIGVKIHHWREINHLSLNNKVYEHSK